MIYYVGPYIDAMMVIEDVEDNCPDLHVGLVPCTLTLGPILNSREWVVIVAESEEVPMLQMFAFTDEKRRTFQWGLDEDRGETFITCHVTQDYVLPIETPEGPKVRGMQVFGFGKERTAQIAYDTALADLLVNLKDADAKLRTMSDMPLVNVTIDEGPHRLFGTPDEEPRRLVDMPPETP